MAKGLKKICVWFVCTIVNDSALSASQEET